MRFLSRRRLDFIAARESQPNFEHVIPAVYLGILYIHMNKIKNISYPAEW